MNTSSTKTPEKLLHPKEAAQVLCMSEAWLARERWKKTGPAYVEVGSRARRYRYGDLLDWIEKNRVGASK